MLFGWSSALFDPRGVLKEHQTFVNGYASWKEVFKVVLGSIIQPEQQIPENEVLNSLVVLKKLGMTNSPFIDYELTQVYICSALASTRLQWSVNCLKHKNPLGAPSVLERKCLSVALVYFSKKPEKATRFVENVFGDWSFIIQQRQQSLSKSAEKSPFLKIFVPINDNLLGAVDKIIIKLSLKEEKLHKAALNDCLVDLLVRNSLIENPNSDLAGALIKISSRASGFIAKSSSS